MKILSDVENNSQSTKISSSSCLNYRADIDGLRAIAVLAVIAFHFAIGCPGGYVGVDVFFVISGYLITGLLIKDFEDRTFSLKQFWLRRCRRILPAVFAMMIGTMALSYWLFLPYNLMQMAKSAVAQSLFVSNLNFWRDRSYFNQESDWKPLLHTWSLSVEEQFYIVLPIIFLVVLRWKRQWLYPSIFAATLLSFILNCSTIYASPAATFYLLPTRAWELLAGSLLATGAIPNRSRLTLQWLPVIGLLLIFWSVFAYDRHTLFPGAAALAPVVGTMLVIASPLDVATPVQRLLSLSPLVFVGKLSYSLYLWHWPLLSIARYAADGELALTAKIAVLLITIVAAYLSYVWVERPIHSRRWLVSNKKLLLTLGSVWFLISATALYFYLSDGCVFRSQLAVSEAPEIYPLSTIQTIRGGKLPVLGDTGNGRPSFIVWGDSHAAMNMPMINELAEQRKLSGIAAAMSSSPPLPGCENGWNPNLREWNAGVEKIIESENIMHVFLFARWSNYVLGASENDLLHGTTPEQPLVFDDPLMPKTSKVAASVFLRSIRELCQRLTDDGRHVYLIPQIPEQPKNVRKTTFINERTFGVLPADFESTNRSDFNRQQSVTRQTFSNLAAESKFIELIPSERFLFAEDNHSIVKFDNRLLYDDTHHLSIYGTDLAIRPLLEPIFDEIRDSFSSTEQLK